MSKKNNFRPFITLLSISSLIIFSGCSKKVKNSDAALKESVNIILASGNWTKAQIYAKMALKADANNVDAQIMYAVCQNKLGNTEEAIKTLRNIVLANSGSFLAQLNLGKILYDTKNYEEAYEYLGNACNLNNSSLNALVLYAQCAGKLQTKNTPDLYLKLAQTPQYSDKPEVYNNIGTYYVYSKNYNAALKYFLQAYRMDKDNPIVIANLGILKDSYMKDPKQAKYFYRKFISLTINNSAFDSQRNYFSNRLRELKK